jgi:hypothetical protein
VSTNQSNRKTKRNSAHQKPQLVHPPKSQIINLTQIPVRARNYNPNSVTQLQSQTIAQTTPKRKINPRNGVSKKKTLILHHKFMG